MKIITKIGNPLGKLTNFERVTCKIYRECDVIIFLYNGWRCFVKRKKYCAVKNMIRISLSK